MIHQKKTGVTVRLRSLNLGKAIAMAICPIICLFYYLARALMHDVACEFACAEGWAERIHCKKKDGGCTFYHNTLRTKLSALGIGNDMV